jgi:hypothetical protein
VYAISSTELVAARHFELSCKVVPQGSRKSFDLSVDVQMSGGDRNYQTAVVTARSGSTSFPSIAGEAAKVGYGGTNIAGVRAEKSGKVFEYIFNLPTKRDNTFVGTALMEIWSEPGDDQRPLASGICGMEIREIKQ